MTTGNIEKNMTIYLSSSDSQAILGNGLLEEMSTMDQEEFSDVAKTILEKDVHSPFSLIRIAHNIKKFPSLADTRKNSKNQLDILKNKSLAIKDSVVQSQIWGKAKNTIKDISLEE